MNYLAEYMNAKGITPTELSEMSGISANNIGLMMKREDISRSFNYTQRAIANALGITVSELVNGGDEMKNKILETEIRKHAEALAVALRKFKGEPMYFHLTIFSRDNTADEDDPDYYDFCLHEFNEETEEIVDLTSKAYLIHYGDEGIAYTTPFYINERNSNDSPN